MKPLIHINHVGSPPHTWRILFMMKLQVIVPRITSTYVENTFRFSLYSSQLEDHLHIRGEYGMQFEMFLIMEGSPPHTWRILNFIIKFINRLRITSTYVENTVNKSLYSAK